DLLPQEGDALRRLLGGRRGAGHVRPLEQAAKGSAGPRPGILAVGEATAGGQYERQPERLGTTHHGAASAPPGELARIMHGPILGCPDYQTQTFLGSGQGKTSPCIIRARPDPRSAAEGSDRPGRCPGDFSSPRAPGAVGERGVWRQTSWSAGVPPPRPRGRAATAPVPLHPRGPTPPPPPPAAGRVPDTRA